LRFQETSQLRNKEEHDEERDDVEEESEIGLNVKLDHLRYCNEDHMPPEQGLNSPFHVNGTEVGDIRGDENADGRILNPVKEEIEELDGREDLKTADEKE
jgi:hypothetical protein